LFRDRYPATGPHATLYFQHMMWTKFGVAEISLNTTEFCSVNLPVTSTTNPQNRLRPKPIKSDVTFTSGYPRAEGSGRAV
jgi:hypothetical protein